MLRYNNDGTLSSTIINAIIEGKITASAESFPTIYDTFIASASNAAFAAANPSTVRANFNTGSVYTMSGITPTSSVFNPDLYIAGQNAKTISRVEANFAYNYVTPIYEIVPSDTVFNSNFAHNNMRISTFAFPGGGSGAVTFNGTSQYFTAPNAQVVNWLPGTGDFTIEFFIKNGTQSVGAPRVFSLGFDTGATIGISIEGGYVYVWPYGSDLRGTTPANYNNGTAWMHVAICRSGTTTKLFMNGVLKATKTGDNRNINDSINPGFNLNVGVDNPEAMSPNWWAGKLTNFRWDNSAIYTGASLDVPTAPLTKTATTKLLMLGGGASNPVYDAAKINTLVNNGSVWDAETPFS